MLELTFFGVGDGDSVLIRFPNGDYGLVDACKHPETGEAPPLEKMGAKKLEFVCLTHPHEDHFSGLVPLLAEKRVTTREFWYALTDLDDVIPALKTHRIRGGDTDIARRRRDERYGKLIDLFDWVDELPEDARVEVREMKTRRIGGVDLIVFGPDRRMWNRYRSMVIENRIEQTRLNRYYANAISITMLLRYGEHMVWLLADAMRGQLKKLAKREREEVLPSSQKGVRATVLKVSHHGAKNGWFKTISSELMRCEKDDVVVFSAAGNRFHPHQDVDVYWRETGKRLVGTWTTDLTASRSRLGGWASDTIDEIAPPLGLRKTQDIVVRVPESGDIDVVTKT